MLSPRCWDGSTTKSCPHGVYILLRRGRSWRKTISKYISNYVYGGIREVAAPIKDQVGDSECGQLF